MTSEQNDTPADDSEPAAPEADGMQRRLDELGEHIDDAAKKAQATRDQARQDPDETTEEVVGDWSDTKSSDDDPSGAVGDTEDAGRH